MLTKQEMAQFRVGRLFDPLADTKPLLYNPYTEQQWTNAKREFERLIAPVEAAVASQFKRNVAPILDHPQMLLNEFQKYRNLMALPSIRRELVSEREALLRLLKDLVKKLEVAVDRVDEESDEEEARFRSGNSVGGGSTMARNKLMSPYVSGIVVFRQIEAKVVAMQDASRGILSDVDGFVRFDSDCKSLIEKIASDVDSRFEL